MKKEQQQQIVPRLRNARFWTMWNNDWVKLTLQPGQVLRVFNSTPDEEGYSFEAETYAYDGDTVCLQWANGGRDCDGPMRRSGSCKCDRDRLRGRVCHDPQEKRNHFQGKPILIPVWEKSAATLIEDAFAAASGY